MKSEVLEIGAGKKNTRARGIWVGSNLTTIDIDPSVDPDRVWDCRIMPPEFKDKFDFILAHDVLSCFPYARIPEILRYWGECLKPATGEINIMVYSLEWICRNILSEEPSPIVLPLLFGNMRTQYDIYMAGFTMRKLRADCDAAGLAVFHAKSVPIKLAMNGKEYVGEQHHVVAVRKELKDGQNTS